MRRGLVSERLASLLRARLGPGHGGASRSPFAELLREHEDERHRRIAERLPTSGDPFPSRNPSGWRAEDYIGNGDGFLPLADAARTLALSEAETLEMCGRGLLEAEERGGLLYVRPAIVSGPGIAFVG